MQYWVECSCSLLCQQDGDQSRMLFSCILFCYNLRISVLVLQELAAIKEHRVSKGGDTGESSMFVARTRETLQKTLRDCSLHHLPLLMLSSEKLLSNGHPASQLADDGSTELLKRGRLVRVLIHAPRKGVFDEGAIIYLPLPSDVNSYFCSYVLSEMTS